MCESPRDPEADSAGRTRDQRRLAGELTFDPISFDWHDIHFLSVLFQVPVVMKLLLEDEGMA